MIRQQRLRKEYDQYRVKIKKGDLSMPAKRKVYFGTNESSVKEGTRPIFAQTIATLNIKYL